MAEPLAFDPFPLRRSQQGVQRRVGPAPLTIFASGLGLDFSEMGGLARRFSPKARDRELSRRLTRLLALISSTASARRCSMRRTTLPGTDVETSVLGFGCQPILAMVDAKSSLRALHQAFESGVRHFDLAPSYGLGEAEGFVGRFIRSRRGQVTLTTKFGILPSKGAARLSRLKPLVRGLLRRVPALRSAMRSRLGPLTLGGHFGPSIARQSIETSLRTLGTDYIDILLMHDCRRDGFEPAAMQEISDELKRTGKIRAFGLATSIDETTAILEAGRPTVDIVQFADNLFKRNGRRLPAPLRAGVIKHSIFQFRVEDVEAGLLATLRRLLIESGFDPAEPGIWRDLSLAHACFSNPRGVAICSMFDPRHIERNVEIASGGRFAPELLSAIDAAS